jgi:hypothetical protein
VVYFTLIFEMNFINTGGLMKFKCGAWLFAVMFVLLSMAAPGVARGAAAPPLIVEHNPTSGHFSSIQDAINNAKTQFATDNTLTFTIKVKADVNAYDGSFTPISNMSIVGDSTAGTFLTGTTIANLSSVSSVEIRNFTFKTATVGISVQNSSATITNNVFQLGTAGTTAILVQGSSGTIANNTFFSNGIAINATSAITITNNIFSNNGTAIAGQTAAPTFNDYFNNQVIGVTLDSNSIPNTKVTLSDPLFVTASLVNGDFHLKSGSPAIGSGNPQSQYINSFNSSSDMGAYGGPASDPQLSAVTGLTAKLSPTSPSTIVLNWSQSTNGRVTGYRVYYGTASGAYHDDPTKPANQATEGASPLKVAGIATTTQTLSGLPITKPAAPTAPQLTGLAPLDRALQVTWSQVLGATGYRVYYSTASFDANSLPTTFIPVTGETVTSTTIPDLTNGTTYFVAVASLTQTTFFAAVTAVVDLNIAANFGAASANESAFSPEVSQAVSEISQSVGISNVMSDFPETPAPFPNLKSEGCFIATAAYGFYSAPQVQALRDFRDRYLLTNAPGRAFVAWYYHYGPRGAHFINLHPWLKAPVRLALLPLVIGALVLTGGSTMAKTAVVLLAISLLVALRHRKKVRYTRRPQLEKLLLTLFLIILPSLAQGAEVRPDRPHWSLELKGGVYFPDTPDWKKFYDSSYTGQYGGALAYKVLRQVEVGLAGSYLNASGKGQLPLHSGSGSQATTGDVTYELFPLDVYVLARAIFKEDQLLVPYAAAGYTRLFYREELKGQETVKGSVNGYHGRAGVQILLDGLEADASRNLYHDYGIHHTYLFLEGKYLHAKADTVSSGSVNLGGASCLGGFLFEF